MSRQWLSLSITAQPAWSALFNSLKDTLGISNRKTSNVITTKADLFLAGIVQLLCVLLAHKLHNPNLARRVSQLPNVKGTNRHSSLSLSVMEHIAPHLIGRLGAIVRVVIKKISKIFSEQP